MEHTRPGRVHRLQFRPPAQLDFLESHREQLLGAVHPGNRTTRYNRTWIVGQTDNSAGVLSGRIGFEGGGFTDVWDDEAQDFIETAIPNGFTAPFAINLETFEAVMQPRSSQIKIQSLIGAFEGLLLDAGHKWKVVGFRQSITLEHWKSSVEKVTFVKFTIRKPNPHYHGAKDLEDLMGELSTDVIRLEARAEAGVNLDANFIKETEGHVERGYGEAEYRGIKGTGSDAHESVFVTTVGSEEDSEEAAVDPETGEVPTATLRTLLEQQGAEGENDDPAQPADD